MVKLPLLIGLVISISNFASGPVPQPLHLPQDTVVMTGQELKFVELANRERASRGLSELTIEPDLIGIARQHSREMAEKHYFSHESPTRKLKTPLDRYLAGVRERPSWALVGENLFYCSIVDVNRGHVALMNSEGHRANILEDRFEQIGVGEYTTATGEYYVTQMFLAKRD